MSTKSRSIRRQSASKVPQLAGDRIIFNGMRGVVLSTDGNEALCLLHPQGDVSCGGLSPIPLPRPLCITGKQLKEINAESIRLGFSRNLEGIEVIPDALNIPICTAFHHVSNDPIPKRNIRLAFSLPTLIPQKWRAQIKKMAKTLVSVTLDIPPDTFAVVQQQKASCCR